MMTQRERRAFNKGLEAAAQAAELFADENQRMATDTILSDPILNKSMRKNLHSLAAIEEASRKADLMAIQGSCHAAMAQAGDILKKLIRDLKVKA
jgi:hypothetical protein